MSDGDWIDDIITIRDTTIPVKVGDIEHIRLLFYTENPRIYSVVRADNQEPSQDEIETELLSMDHVKALIQDIKENGGLMDPVIVRDGSFEVLEGNSRLAAYRALASKDPIRWGRIRCKLLPRDISDDFVFALLGQYHIKGKKDWAPYEQAGFLYRRHKFQSVSLTDLGRELGLGRRRVGQLIETYEFMVAHKDTNVNRWSYYEEFIKSNRIRRIREKHPKLDEQFVSKVKSGEIGRAVDVRDKLQKVACAKDKVVTKFVTGEITFDEACEMVDDSGHADSTYRKVSTFRSWLATPEAQAAILEADKNTFKKLEFELQKLKDNVTRLHTRMSSRN